jgi:hypothetical protein
MALGAFLVFALIGQVLNILVCLAIDKIFSPMTGALTFVGLYILVFVVAWQLALYFFDREPEKPVLLSRR